MCLQGMVDELMMKKAGARMKRVNDSKCFAHYFRIINLSNNQILVTLALTHTQKKAPLNKYLDSFRSLSNKGFLSIMH